jgi:hypothetical protein
VFRNSASGGAARPARTCLAPPLAALRGGGEINEGGSRADRRGLRGVTHPTGWYSQTIEAVPVGRGSPGGALEMIWPYRSIQDRRLRLVACLLVMETGKR